MDHTTFAKNSRRIPQESLFRARSKSEQVIEDRRLTNWKRWLNDRARIQKRLSEKLNREPVDLALNSHERARLKAENQDRYRGSPAFRRLPGTTQKDASVTMDRAARCLPPELIKREKYGCDKIDAVKLKKETGPLDRDPASTADLVIIGRDLDRAEAPKFTGTPVITITPELTKKVYLSDPDERVALKLQDREFVLERGRHFERLSAEETRGVRARKEEEDNRRYAHSTTESDRLYRIHPIRAKPATWAVNFESRSGELCERRIALENRGVRVVSVSWRDATPSLLPAPRRVPRLASKFFFNKNCVRVLPGQRVEVPFWFRSDEAAVATETWKMLVEPKVYPGALKVRLWGLANGEAAARQAESRGEEIRQCVRSRVRNTTVRELVEEVFAEATAERQLENGIAYEMFFLRTDVFHARNPSCSYRSSLVGELSDMYNAAAVDGRSVWSLSLDELRSVLLAAEDPLERRGRLLLRFREIGDELLRPNAAYSRPRLPKEKLARWLLAAFLNDFELESGFAMENSQIGSTEEDVPLYREIFHVRIKCLLGDTVDRICAALHSSDYFNKDAI